MKLSTNRNDFLALLDTCASACDEKSHLPALSCVMISADGNTISVRGTDIYVTIIGSQDAVVAQSGECAVSARLLRERVSALSPGRLCLDMSGDTIKIGQPDSLLQFSLMCADKGTFPKLAESTDFFEEATVSSIALTSLLDGTKSSMGKSGRAEWCSTELKIQDGVISAVSTDGYSVAYFSDQLEAKGTNRRWLLSRKSSEALRKLCLRFGGDVAVVSFGKLVKFSVGSLSMITTPMDGELPDFRRLLPKSVRCSALVSREELERSAGAVKLSCRETGIDLSAGPGKVSLHGESTTAGVSQDLVVAECENGSAEIRINPDFLINGLKSFSCDSVRLDVGDRNDPLIIRADGGSERFVAIAPQAIR